MGIKEPVDNKDITHGICPDCAEKLKLYGDANIPVGEE
jgi:hypothetical protein